jgi:hypothetical protein
MKSNKDEDKVTLTIMVVSKIVDNDHCGSRFSYDRREDNQLDISLKLFKHLPHTQNASISPEELVALESHKIKEMIDALRARSVKPPSPFSYNTNTPLDIPPICKRMLKVKNESS